MSLLKKGERVADLTIEERAVLWLHKHYPNIEVVDLEAASKQPTTYIFPDYVHVHIINTWHKVDGKIYSKKQEQDIVAVAAGSKTSKTKPSYY
jgi:hypothetical protein